jgi:hypothetical protein
LSAASLIGSSSLAVVGAGLRYDDLYDPYHDLDIKEALARLPREVVDARNQRLKRAMDLSMKHQYLPDDVQVRIRACSSLCNSNALYTIAIGKERNFR